MCFTPRNTFLTNKLITLYLQYLWVQNDHKNFLYIIVSLEVLVSKVNNQSRYQFLNSNSTLQTNHVKTIHPNTYDLNYFCYLCATAIPMCIAKQIHFDRV